MFRFLLAWCATMGSFTPRDSPSPTHRNQDQGKLFLYILMCQLVSLSLALSKLTHSMTNGPKVMSSGFYGMLRICRSIGPRSTY